jgi:myo-inositol 2-dehydrogenase / D-chiro-inositol 1-dehydrogenase
VFELEDQMAMLVKAIREGGKLSCRAEDGRWSVAMCLAAQQSVDRGEPVAIRSII